MGLGAREGPQWPLQRGGSKATSQLQGLKKMGCKPDGDNAYYCEMEMDIEASFVGHKTVTAPLRFVKAGPSASKPEPSLELHLGSS